MTNLVGAKEVVISFLTANKFKDASLIEKLPLLEERLRDSIVGLSALSEKELLHRIKDRVRKKNIFHQSWTIEEVPLKYIGSYPRIGDLPQEWCQSSVVDTAKFVDESRQPTTFDSVRRILQIQPRIDVILKYLLPILLPGGEIRKGDKLLSLPYDSDDGNHRLVAAALTGKETVLAYVGIP